MIHNSKATKCGCGLNGLHSVVLGQEPISCFESYIQEMEFRERLTRVLVNGVVQLSRGE